MHDFTLLFHALASSETVFVLGAGASMPEIPTIASLPNALRPYAKYINSFPAGRYADSPLRELIEPLIAESRLATSIEGFLPGAMSPGFIAALIEDLILQAHYREMPQYAVFSLFDARAAVLSFNWDGLAKVRCIQRTVIHPHGAVQPRQVLSGTLADRLDWAQDDEEGVLRDVLLPGICMPGEEERPEYAPVRERIFNLWLNAGSIVVVGYSFGIGSQLRYDRIWLDAFVTAMSHNRTASIHVVSPDALELREQLCELLAHRQHVNVHAWPLRWDVFSKALLREARNSGARSVVDLIGSSTRLAQAYTAAVFRAS